MPTVPAVARLLEPVRWEPSCLDGDCALGSLAADALCAWAAGASPVVCAVPTRFLGGGLPAGSVAWTELAEVWRLPCVVTL